MRNATEVMNLIEKEGMTDFTFQSLKLNSVMKPLDGKRKTMEGHPCDDRRTTVRRNAHNQLKTNTDVFLSKGE